MTPDEINGLIAELTAERETLVREANARIAYLNGKIEMLQELLARQNGHVPEAEIAETVEG